MIHIIYAVFDKKVGAYAQPFFVTHEQVALRAFASACVDKDLAIGKFPEDYALYRLGTYDDSSGAISSEMAFVVEAVQASIKEVA